MINRLLKIATNRVMALVSLRGFLYLPLPVEWHKNDGSRVRIKKIGMAVGNGGSNREQKKIQDNDLCDRI